MSPLYIIITQNKELSSQNKIFSIICYKFSCITINFNIELICTKQINRKEDET